MTSLEIQELNEAKDLIKAGRYDEALVKLYPLTDSYPQDQEIQKLIKYCQSDQKLPQQSKLTDFQPTGFYFPIPGIKSKKKPGPK